ncbi:hypothetical protein [Streptacidiphilus monticola]|uniref:PH domain-containing protein n=1 Tax=Streptacidiphilus monticola TaxID=2161674 RepID=A0ABW1FW59_9ACTN
MTGNDRGGEPVAVHRSRRYVPLAVRKWTGYGLIALFWLLLSRGIWWQGLVVDAVVIGALWLVGQLPPSSGLLAVEVWPDALRLRVAAATEPLTVAWADVLDVAFVARDENYEYVSGGRSRWSVRHAAVVLAVNGQTEPLVLVHLRRPQQLAVEIARHAAAVRAATADRAEA